MELLDGGGRSNARYGSGGLIVDIYAFTSEDFPKDAKGKGIHFQW